MYKHNVTALLNRSRRLRQDVQGLMWLQTSQVSPTTSCVYKQQQQQQQQCRNLASIMMIKKLRLYDSEADFPEAIFLRKKAKQMEYDPWAPPTPSRPVVGGGGGGGGRGGSNDRFGNYSGGDGGSKARLNTFGSSYRRHPDDPTDDDLDVEEIERIIEERNDAKRDRDFELADNIRDQLVSEHHVVLNDRERTWSTNPANAGRLGTSSPAEDFGPNGHDYKLYDQAGQSISPLKEKSIHDLIAERLRCKLARDFVRADQIKMELIDAHVQLDDDNKLWRSDGKRFLMAGVHDYAYAPDAGPIKSSMRETQIKDLIRERLACKFNRDFVTADNIKGELEDAGVFLNDNDRLWRADGESFPRGSPRGDYGDEDGGGGGTENFHTFLVFDV